MVGEGHCLCDSGQFCVTLASLVCQGLLVPKPNSITSKNVSFPLFPSQALLGCHCHNYLCQGLLLGGKCSFHVAPTFARLWQYLSVLPGHPPTFSRTPEAVMWTLLLFRVRYQLFRGSSTPASLSLVLPLIPGANSTHWGGQGEKVASKLWRRFPR